MHEGRLKEAAAATPDPERALKNLLSFSEEHPDSVERLAPHLKPAALLFSCSQFLANYSIANPDDLFVCLEALDRPFDRDQAAKELHGRLDAEGDLANRTGFLGSMQVIRRLRLRHILGITLRDLLGKADLVEIMADMSHLADLIVAAGLAVTRCHLGATYGDPLDDAFTVISLGKLGGEELNFSSDIDLIFVYGTEKGETSGIRSEQGILKNRITNHEFYCKLGEELTRYLSANTEAGFAYRVDLRLRPEGQRGDIALALRGYEMYYESWGRAWERAMLLRARPIAGDDALGSEFLEMIRPFVYRKYLDFSAIEEIRKLKTRIDSTFKKGDIKRGYGGIREIEFFGQALQLIYGGREPLLQERSILKVLHRLFQKGLIGQEDLHLLSTSYRYYRTLEHRLQQVNDLQTHTIPSSGADLDTVARKMGFSEGTAFMKDLDQRRGDVRRIYDSLFAERTEAPTVSSTVFSEEFSDAELREYLGRFPVRDAERAVRSIRAIQNSMFSFQTLRGRRFLGEILPLFVESALRTNAPDAVLNHLQSFASFLSLNESYLDIFRGNRELIHLLTSVFAQSDYLSKMLMARPRHLEMIGWQRTGRRTTSDIGREIGAAESEGLSLNEAIRLVRQAEEIRLGLLFLQKRSTTARTVKGLSGTAEAIVAACMADVAGDAAGLAVIGFGKLGGREITFGSDLDLIFVTPRDVTVAQTRAAEKLLRMIISYTRDGMAYCVDTRLRPEGSKGPLVSSIEAFRKYYSSAAAFWEFQALLKARPIAGDRETGRSFLRLAKATLVGRGREISSADLRQMRGRIQRELSRDEGGYDLKLGPGGIEEIEFLVQYLQLRNCRDQRRVLVQGTVDGLKRLAQAGVLPADDAAFLADTYLFYRTIETYLRLRGEQLISRDPERVKDIAEFMGLEQAKTLQEGLEKSKERVLVLKDQYLTDSGSGTAP